MEPMTTVELMANIAAGIAGVIVGCFLAKNL